MVSQKSEQFESGALINERYRVQYLLGRGGMGSVYLVEDVLDEGKKRALKTLRLEKMSESVVELFKGEFQLLAQLNHPNLAQVFEFGATPRTPMADPELFFTIEYISGIDLFQATKSASFEKIFDVAVQMCRALEYMGTRGIVHGDLKPANILVEGETVRIVDFGIAPEFYKKSNPGLFGTPKYMAPELIRGDQVDRRADLYSLGVILYLLTARRAPFEAKTPEAFFKKHLEETPVPLHEVRKDTPIEFSRMVSRLLAKDPGDRFFRASQVIAALRGISKTPFALETKETREGYILSGKLVGRESEMQQLIDFERNLTAAAMEKRMCMISAERGGGKTRFIKEWKNRLQVNQVAVFSADLRNPSLRPFFPMANLVDQILGEFHAGRRRLLLEKFPLMFQAFNPKIAAKKKDVDVIPEGAQAYRVYEEASQFFSEVAHLLKAQGRQGLVLIFDPIEALTQQDLEVLHHVIQGAQQEVNPSPILFVFSQTKKTTARDLPEERTGFLTARFDSSHSKSKLNVVDVISDSDATLHIDLHNFSRDEVDQLVVSMVGENLGGEKFARDLTQFSNGNPMLIQEVLRSLAAQGVLSRNESVPLEYLEIDLQKLQIPKTIGMVIQDRLHKFSQAEREMIEALAVFQLPISWEALQRLFPEKSAKRIFQVLAALRGHGEVEASLQRGEVVYQISYGGLRKLVYDEMDGPLRASLHLRFAQVLEREDLGFPQREDLLARHFMLAGESQKASQYVLIAAKYATQKMAYATAVEFYQAALRLFDESSQVSFDERFFVHQEIARISRLQGDYQTSIETLRSLKKSILGVEASVAHRVTVLQDLGYSYLLDGNFAFALAEIDAGLALNPENQKQELKLQWIRGRILLKLNRLDEVLAGAKRGLEGVKGRIFDEERAEFFYNRGMVFYLRKKYANATQEFRKSLQIFERLDLHQRSMLAFNALGMVAFQNQQVSKAISFFEKSFSGALQLGDFNQMLVSIVNLGACHHGSGKMAEAMAYYQKGLGVSEKIMHREYNLLLLENLGRLYAESYHFEKALEFFLKGFHLAQEIADADVEIKFLNYLGAVKMAEDEIEMAEQYFRKCLSLCEQNKNQAGALKCFQELTKICIKKRDWTEAEDMFQKSEALALKTVDLGLQRDQCLLRGRFLVRLFIFRQAKGQHKSGNEARAVMEALKLAEKITRMHQHWRSLWEVLFWYGQFFAAQKKMELAQKTLQEAYQIALKFSKTLPEEYRGFFQASAQFCELKEILDAAQKPGKPAIEQTLYHLQALEGERALFSVTQMRTLLSLLGQMKDLNGESSRLWQTAVLRLMAEVLGTKRNLLIGREAQPGMVAASYCLGEENLAYPIESLAMARECQGFLVLDQGQRVYALRAQGELLAFVLLQWPGMTEVDEISEQRTLALLDLLIAGLLALRGSHPDVSK